jgi:citrate lyase subunit beta/citryl-CoA lyase
MSSHTVAVSSLAAASSFLFVPATRPERIIKALASGAHAVIVDLEDAVSMSDKFDARRHLETVLSALSASQRLRMLVRINASGTPWYADDLVVCARLTALGLGGVMLAKAESGTILAAAAETLGSGCALVPLVESVAGLDAIDAMARVPQVLRLAFGHLDFQVDAGLACDVEDTELVPVRLALVLASRRAGIPAPIDGVTVDTKNAVRLQQDAKRALRGGFGGKMCIHPNQVALVNAAFSPTVDELSRARRILAAFETAGGGVCTLDGHMIDAPVLKMARRTLASSVVI